MQTTFHQAKTPHLLSDLFSISGGNMDLSLVEAQSQKAWRTALAHEQTHCQNSNSA